MGNLVVLLLVGYFYATMWLGVTSETKYGPRYFSSFLVPGNLLVFLLFCVCIHPDIASHIVPIRDNVGYKSVTCYASLYDHKISYEFLLTSDILNSSGSINSSVFFYLLFPSICTSEDK